MSINLLFILKSYRGIFNTKHLHLRKISTGTVFYAKFILNSKNKSRSSQDWLIRQLSDPYVEKAKIFNYRCRSAFKLEEIDDKFKILNPGDVVIDCGAAPGSWSQVAVKRTNADGLVLNSPVGLVISIDLLPIHPILGSIILGSMDFTKSNTQENVKKILNGKKVNTVLSDMAPNATGMKSLDQERIIKLCYSVLEFAVLTNSENSNLLVKVWNNNDVCKLEKEMLKFYQNVKRIKPKATRSDSAEIFLLAQRFCGIESI